MWTYTQHRAMSPHARIMRHAHIVRYAGLIRVSLVYGIMAAKWRNNSELRSMISFCTGADTWSDEFPKCGFKHQSPINILSKTARKVVFDWDRSIVTYGFEQKQGLSYLLNAGHSSEYQKYCLSLG